MADGDTGQKTGENGSQQEFDDTAGSKTKPDADQAAESQNAADENSSLEENPELQERIAEAVAAALAEQRDTVLRARAEVQNMRNRCEADVEKAHKYALEKFSVALLPVMDNMERALQAVPDPEDERVKAICEGIQLTIREFSDILARFNIEVIDPQGQPFDPQFHEAMSMVENRDVEPNTVIAVMQKGYSLNGRVIRPAMVMVAKG